MLTMSLDRAKLIDYRLTKAKINFEKKGYASASFPSNSTMELVENKEIDKILRQKEYGYVMDDGTYVIHPSGIDFLKCGGFTRMIKEEIEDEKDKERIRKRAKREPFFRWLSIILFLTELFQFFLKLFNFSGLE